jgi:hypothetical protein
MARGWESKSVEAQIEEGNQPSPAASPRSPTPESRALQQRIESLRLSRSRLLQQLENARHPLHREVLLKGLQAVEKEIEEITPAPDVS